MAETETIDRQHLVGEVERLRAELNEAERRLTAWGIEHAEFKVGDVIEAQMGRRGWVVAMVREVEPRPSGRGAWYKVSTRNKDGSWSKAVRHAFRGVRAVSHGWGWLMPDGGVSHATPEPADAVGEIRYEGEREPRRWFVAWWHDGQRFEGDTRDEAISRALAHLDEVGRRTPRARPQVRS